MPEKKVYVPPSVFVQLVAAGEPPRRSSTACRPRPEQS